jgi:hypothetical protein
MSANRQEWTKNGSECPDSFFSLDFYAQFAFIQHIKNHVVRHLTKSVKFERQDQII